MNRDLMVATLALAGWVPIRNRSSALTTWGVSHVEYGTIKEDAWHQDYGPSRAPLVVFPMPEHIHQPAHECHWGEIGPLTVERLYNEVVRREAL